MIRLEALQVQAGDFMLSVGEFSVVAGEYVMVLGPTGSGKTVLLETVAGLRRPESGRVWFGDRDVTREPPERRRAGLVYQDYALFPHLTVAQNIGFGALPQQAGADRGVRGKPGVLGTRQSKRDSRVVELAGLFGIDALLDRYPQGLSGGEQQRVALARALAIEPEVLLLDEPLAALDGRTRRELRGELRRLHRDLGATVMHVTHDLDEALALGDKVAVLIDGDLRQVGDPQEVIRRPVDVEVAHLVGLTNILAVTTVFEEAAASPLSGGQSGGVRPASGEAQNDRLPREARHGRWRVRLEGGAEMVAETSRPPPSADRLFAVVRAEEIELEPLAGRCADSHPGAGQDEVTDCDNVLEGTIAAVQVQSVHASVEVEVSPVGVTGAPFVLGAHVLRPDVDRMRLARGSRVHVRIAPSAIHMCKEPIPSKTRAGL